MNYRKEKGIHIHNRTDQIWIKPMGSLFNNHRLFLAPRQFRFLFESLTAQQDTKTSIPFSHRSSGSSFDDRTISHHLRRHSHD